MVGSFRTTTMPECVRKLGDKMIPIESRWMDGMERKKRKKRRETGVDESQRDSGSSLGGDATTANLCSERQGGNGDS